MLLAREAAAALVRRLAGVKREASGLDCAQSRGSGRGETHLGPRGEVQAPSPASAGGRLPVPWGCCRGYATPRPQEDMGRGEGRGQRLGPGRRERGARGSERGSGSTLPATEIQQAPTLWLGGRKGRGGELCLPSCGGLTVAGGWAAPADTPWDALRRPRRSIPLGSARTALLPPGCQTRHSQPSGKRLRLPAYPH